MESKNSMAGNMTPYDALIESYRHWASLQYTVTVTEHRPFYRVEDASPRMLAWNNYTRIRDELERGGK